MISSDEEELQRIRTEYARREREIPGDFYALYRPANLFLRHGQERGLLKALIRAGALPLSGRRILEVGCGRGQWLASFESLGATRKNLAGIELDEVRLSECAARFPGADLRVGNASRLPWRDGEFDIVLQSTVFTSILDGTMKEGVAREMLRVLKPTGAIVWYDFMVDNPRNQNVRGIKRAEMEKLFRDMHISLHRVTLAPPLARKLVPLSWTLAAVLESLHVLNTHYMAVIRRKV